LAFSSSVSSFLFFSKTEEEATESERERAATTGERQCSRTLGQRFGVLVAVFLVPESFERASVCEKSNNSKKNKKVSRLSLSLLL